MDFLKKTKQLVIFFTAEIVFWRKCKNFFERKGEDTLLVLEMQLFPLSEMFSASGNAAVSADKSAFISGGTNTCASSGGNDDDSFSKNTAV